MEGIYTTTSSYLSQFQKIITGSTPYHSIISFNQLLISILQRSPLTNDLLASPASFVITLTFIYVFLFLACYELVLNLGIHLQLWQRPGHDIFIETPTHCAHVYIDLNLIKSANPPVKLQDSKSSHFLSKSINYHFEFSPDEYQHEEYGTNLIFLKQKLLSWFQESKIHEELDLQQPIQLDQVYIFDKKGNVLMGKDDEYLCNLDITTGSTVNGLINLSP